MTINILLNTKSHQYQSMNCILKICIFTLAITNLIACTTESQDLSTKRALTNQEHKRLMLQTKKAMLNLDISLVETLSAKIDVNRPLPDNSSLLAWAVETQDPRLVSLILEKGANAQGLNDSRFKPIIQACRYGNSHIINSLLDHGANVNRTIEDGTSAFQLCAGSASTQDLAKMVKLGANINAQNDYGQTALMWSANFGKVKNLNYLVSIGANINQQTQEGYSPLFFAIKSQNLDTVKAVISHDADIFTTAQDGTTAAQLAVYTKNYEFLIWFIDELNSLMPPAAIQQTLRTFDRDGYQLLHAAANLNQPQLVSKLLALGAVSTTVSQPSKLKWRYEANFKTENYYPPQLTPIEIAERNGFKNIVSILSR